MPEPITPGVYAIPSWLVNAGGSFYYVPSWWQDQPAGSKLYPVALLDGQNTGVAPGVTLSEHTITAGVDLSAWERIDVGLTWDSLPEGTSWASWSGQIVDLPVKTAAVTLDETVAPYASLTLTCVAPDSTDGAIDPRWDIRLKVRLHQTYSTWAFLTPDIDRTFDLTIRTATIDEQTGELAIEATSDEALLIDYGLVATAPYRPGDTTARAVVAHALQSIGAVLADGYGDAAVTAEAAEWLPGVSAWDYLAPIVQASNLRLWCDENRTWRLEEANRLTNGYVDLDYAANLTRASSAVSLSDEGPKAYYDAVVIDYAWTDAAGMEQHTYDTANSGGLKRTLALAYDTKPQAPGAARRVLKRLLANGRSVDVSAVSRFDIAPTMPATIRLPDTAPQAGVVASVTWRLPDDEMDIVTRDLIDVAANSWLSIPPGISWDELAEDTPWTTFDPAVPTPTLEGV